MDDSFSEDPRVPVTLADHLERNFSCSKAMRWALLFALVDGGIAAGADEANTSRALRRERSDKGVFVHTDKSCFVLAVLSSRTAR